MTIRRIAMVVGAALAGILVADECLATDKNSSTVPPLFAVLLGGNEVSPTGEANAGDPNGRGSATVIIDGTKLCFGIVVEAVDTPILAHIHRGVAGVNGPIVVGLVPPESGDPGASSGCVLVSDKELLAQIQGRPVGFYVNVHTELFPAGAVRGQLF
jgi:CHRD domain-containing protein